MGSFYFRKHFPTADLQTTPIIAITHNSLSYLSQSSASLFPPPVPPFPHFVLCFLPLASVSVPDVVIGWDWFPFFNYSQSFSSVSSIWCWIPRCICKSDLERGLRWTVLILVPVSVYSCTAVVISPHCLSAFPPSLSLSPLLCLTTESPIYSVFFLCCTPLTHPGIDTDIHLRSHTI